MPEQFEQNSDKIKNNATHVSETAGQVFRDFVAGMYDEVKNHPGKLLLEAGAGAALTVGALVAAPEVAVGVAIVGAAAGIYEAGKGLMHLADDAKIVDNMNQKYSSTDVQKARLDIRSLGASTMDSLAMAGGGMAGFEASSITLAFSGLGRSRYPFADGLNLRQGLYTAGAMNGLENSSNYFLHKG